MSTLLEYYKKKIGEVRSSAPTADALKTAVLAGLLLADEALRKKDTVLPHQDETEIVLLTEKLIQTLDECLVPHSKESPSTSETSSFE